MRLERFLRPGKLLLKTSESSRFLISIIWGHFILMFWKKNWQNSCWILAPFLSEAIETAWGQKSFKWFIRHKFPLLKKPLSITQVLIELSKHLIKPCLYFISIPNGWPCIWQSPNQCFKCWINISWKLLVQKMKTLLQKVFQPIAELFL